MQTPLQWWRQRGWLARTLTILVALYVLYALVVFFILPGWLQKKGEKTLSDLLGRSVTIEKLSLNPLALSATVDGFSIQDPQTGTLVSFKRLYVNAEMWASLFHWRPWVGDLSLQGLDVRVRRNADGSFNFDDVTRHIAEAGKNAPPKPESEKNQPLPAFTVGHLALTDGNVTVTDVTGDKPVTLKLPVAFNVDGFTTLTPEKDQNRYVLHIAGPNGGTLDWDGHFQLQPLMTSGHLAMDKVNLVSFAQLLEPRFRFRLPSGQLGLAADYRFSEAPGQGLTVQNGSLTLSNLDIVRQGNDKPSLAFPAIAVRGLSLDTAKRRLNVPEVTISKPVIHAVRSKQGLDLATLFLPKEQGTADQPAPPEESQDAKPADAGGQAQSPWNVTLDKLAIKDAGVSLRDETLAHPADLDISNMALTLSDVEVGKAIRWKWQGSATLLGSGQLQHSGAGQLAPLDIQANLDLKTLPLKALQPWIADAVPLVVKKGSAHSQLKLAISGEQPTVTVTGAAGLDQLAVQQQGQPFVSIKALDAKGLDISTGKHLLALNQLTINDLDFINRIDKSGKDSITRLVNSGSGQSSSSAKKGPQWRVKLNRVTVKNSRLAHRDASLSPPFKVSLQQWDGTLKGFDTAGGKAKLSMTGKINGNAPLKASGSVDADPLFVDLDLSLTSYGMDTLTPYTGRYLGYKVQRGLLTVNSKLEIDKQQLDSNTQIDADRFYLGDSVASDQALSVPVKLGLAVLRDASGKIELPVTVSGDMSDPSFSVSGLVLKVITNILVKAATAPFSLLAGLVGGEDLDQIAFPPGDPQPGAETRQKLASLVEALSKRPSLKVQITGETGAADREALARKALLDDMGGDWPGLDKAVADGGWFGWRGKILGEYKDRLKQDPDKLPAQGDGDAAEMQRVRLAWQKLMESAEKAVSSQTLQQLATQRASAARKTLVKEHHLAAGRVTLGGTPKIDADNGGIHLGLDNQ